NRSSKFVELIAHPTTQELPTGKRPRDFIDFRFIPSDASQVSTRRAIGKYLFSDSVGYDKKEMLNFCYINPGFESQFTASIRRLLRDQIDMLSGVNDMSEGSTKQFIGEITSREEAEGIRHPVVVVGNVGVGKTTFLHKTLSHFREADT